MENEQEISVIEDNLNLSNHSDFTTIKRSIDSIRVSPMLRLVNRLSIEVSLKRCNISKDELKSLSPIVQCIRESDDNCEIVLKDRYAFVDDHESEIKASKEELLDCIHNLMGCFDTPIGRRLIKDPISNEAREIARKIMDSNGRSVLG